jgi:hypothetical protein
MQNPLDHVAPASLGCADRIDADRIGTSGQTFPRTARFTQG